MNTDQLDGIKTKILCEVFNCGSMDVDFVIKELNNYEIDLNEIEWKNCSDINYIISSIYEKACEKAGIEDIYDNSIYEVSIFTNFLDNHLHINDEEMYCFEDIKNIVKKTNETIESMKVKKHN